MPAICFLGILGNVLNLVVLTRRNMKGIAYIYMRGNTLYSSVLVNVSNSSFSLCEGESVNRSQMEVKQL
jgi:hypothetical protein